MCLRLKDELKMLRKMYEDYMRLSEENLKTYKLKVKNFKLFGVSIDSKDKNYKLRTSNPIRFRK